MRQRLETPEWGLVSLAGVSLHTDAWQCVNSYLLMDRAPKRRNNTIRPGAAGVRGKTGYPDEIIVELEVSLIGDYTRTGAINADHIRGEEENYLYLVENIYEALTDWEDAVQAIVTSRISGVTYEGPVQINRMWREDAIQGSSCVKMEVGMIRGELAIVGH